MRQLKGSAKKETKKERRERREGNAIAKQKALTIAVPIVIGGLVLLFVYLYFATRSGRT